MSFRAPVLLMMAITACYAAVAFVNLGEVTAPHTFATVKHGEQIVVDLGEKTDITRIALYVGICNGQFTLEYSDTARSWLPVTNYNETGTGRAMAVMSTIKSDINTSFSWLVLRFNNLNARYLRITGQSDDEHASVGMVGEIGVFNGAVQIPLVPIENSNLTDEQKFVRHSHTFMNSAYFDEIYFPRTAYEILNKMTIYETTHPPLGKLIIAVGIKLFGMTPFGWRVMGTLFGIAMLPLMFFLAKKVLKDERLAVLATALFACDFMHFSLTRIGTVDTYLVFFIMLTFLFLCEYTERAGNTALKTLRRVSPLVLSGVCFGLGCATKWNVAFTAAGILAVILLTWRRVVKAQPASGKNAKPQRGIAWRRIGVDFLVCLVAFIVIPAVIYVVSFIPQAYWFHGPFIKSVINMQEFMFGYHSQLEASHSFSSPAWSWPIIMKPLWVYNDREAGAYGLTGAINIMGTPIIWWLGLAAVLATIVWAFVKRTRAAVFISISYATQYVFWFFVTRAIFIYHYFASVPFMIVALCFWMGKAPQWTRIVLAAVAVLVFAAFYPVLSGMRIPFAYAKWLLWNKHWVLFSWN